MNNFDIRTKMTHSLALSRHEQKAAFHLFVIFCLAYIYELANFNVSIDDEMLATSHICHFAEIGRWLHPVVRKIFWPQMVLPAGPMIIFGGAIALSFVYLLRLFSVKEIRPPHYLIFSAFALYPTWMAQLEFSANVIPVAFGLIAAVVAAWLVLNAGSGIWSRTWIKLLAAMALVSVAVGAYQSLALLVLVFILAGALVPFVTQPAPSSRLFWHRAALGMGALVGGMALALVLGKLVILACDATTGAYARQFFHPDSLLEKPVRMLTIMFRDAGRQVWGHWKPFGVARFVFTAAVLASALICVRAASAGQRLLVSCVLFVTFLVPTGFIYVAGDSLPLRVYFGTAAMVCSFLMLAHVGSKTAVGKGVVAALALLVASQGLYINSVQQARGWAVQRHDAALASSIYSEVRRLRGADGGAVYLNFHGMKRFHTIYPAVVTTSQGASFFEWDDGNLWRMISYMSMIGYHDVRAFPERTPGEFAPVYADMPAWPAEGSVRRVNGVFLIKLSDP